MKRTILASLVVSSSILFISQAQAMNGNWLVGGSIGYGESNGSLDSNVAYLDQAGIATQIENISQVTSIHNNGLLGGLLVGYQVVCDRLIAGLELNADWYEDYDSHDFTLIAGPKPAFRDSLGYVGSAEYKHDLTVGLTARFGYSLTEYLIPYIRLGAEGTRDHLDVAYVCPFAFNVGNSSFTGSISESNTKYRFVGGIGLEIPFCSLAKTDNFMRGLSARAEYNYHGRHHGLDGQVVSLDSLFTPGLSDQAYAAGYKSNFNTGKLSLVWNFG